MGVPDIYSGRLPPPNDALAVLIFESFGALAHTKVRPLCTDASLLSCLLTELCPAWRRPPPQAHICNICLPKDLSWSLTSKSGETLAPPLGDDMQGKDGAAIFGGVLVSCVKHGRRHN